MRSRIKVLLKGFWDYREWKVTSSVWVSNSVGVGKEERGERKRQRGEGREESREIKGKEERERRSSRSP